ncbi:MAG: hypothetical protein ACR2GY_06535 [Phycisphaerales bacterium]
MKLGNIILAEMLRLGSFKLKWCPNEDYFTMMRDGIGNFSFLFSASLPAMDILTCETSSDRRFFVQPLKSIASLAARGDHRLLQLSARAQGKCWETRACSHRDSEIACPNP